MGFTVQVTRLGNQWTESELSLNYFWTSNLLNWGWLHAGRAPNHSQLARPKGGC